MTKPIIPATATVQYVKYFDGNGKERTLRIMVIPKKETVDNKK